MLDKLMTKEVKFIPDELENGLIYVSDEFQIAIHLCACGCGEKTVTPFGSPSGWELKKDIEGITLSPSIGNQNFACKSHYYLKNGKVIKC